MIWLFSVRQIRKRTKDKLTSQKRKKDGIKCYITLMAYKIIKKEKQTLENYSKSDLIF